MVKQRSGFSLIEILVVLAIFAMGTAMIMPSTSRMLDQTTAHAVFFEFQRQVSDYRREASRTGQAIVIIDPVAAEVRTAISASDKEEDISERVVEMRGGWTYSLAPKLEIEAGGHCSTASANLINKGRVIMSLRTEDGQCRFARYVSAPTARAAQGGERNP